VRGQDCGHHQNEQTAGEPRVSLDDLLDPHDGFGPEHLKISQ
jgi:hypothetical protein